MLYLGTPAGSDRAQRRRLLDTLERLNQLEYERIQDPEVLTRIKQYELAYRMQTSVPELADISSEPQDVLDLYGPEVHKKGSYAYNCLLARRLAERGVRFIQRHITLLLADCGTDSPRKDMVSDTESTRAQIENRLKTISGRSIFGDCLRRKTTRAAISSGTILT